MTKDELKAKRVYLAGRTKKVRRWLGMFYDRYPHVTPRENMEYAITNAIADLMHICTEEGWDYWRLQEQGLQHHNAEQRGGQHG